MRATTGGQSLSKTVTTVVSSTRAPVPPRRLWTVWAVALAAYTFAITQRTSFGAASLSAGERFGVSPGVLSMFVFLQIGVYALGQIPAGLLVDRRGPRTMMVTGGAVLAVAQLLMAFADSLPLAALARVLVGAGDAMVFASTLALIPRWFPAARVPFMTQLTTIIGQLGQITSTIPLVLLLAGVGWTPSFALVGVASLVVAGLTFLLVRDTPTGAAARGPKIPPKALAGQLRAVWARPGTRLGFFGHMGTQYSMMTFSLLWGLPYLVSAQGMTPIAAAGLMTVMVLTTVVIGPLFGVFCGRHPMRRSLLMLAIIAVHVVLWTVVLLLPGPAPLWLLVLLVMALAIGGPASGVGFDIARTNNPASSLAVAQGMVNVGGFGASLFTLAAVGGILTLMGGFSPEAFRVAWLVQYVVWAVAITGIVVTRRKVRRVNASRGIDGPRPLRQIVRGRRTRGPAGTEACRPAAADATAGS